VHKIEEHRRKYDRLRKERNEKRAAREREARRAEAQVFSHVFSCSRVFLISIPELRRDHNVHVKEILALYDNNAFWA